MDQLIGLRLKAYRQSTKTSMSKVAKATNLSKEMLYKWEKGAKPSLISDYKALYEYLKNNDPRFPSYAKEVDAEVGEIGPYLGDLFPKLPDMIVNVTSDSLAPTFQPGMKLCLTELKNTRLLVWGLAYYFIDRNGKEILRQAFPGRNNEEVTLCSTDERRYPPLTIQFSDVAFVYDIMAAVTIY